MEPPSPENSSIIRQSAIRELIRGREFATELQLLLQKPVGDSGSETVDALLEKIMQSLSDSLSMLNSGQSGQSSHHPSTTHVCSLRPDDPRINDSEEKTKIPEAKDRRKGYKRRRSAAATWKKVSTTPFEDGHGWRKYGQKDILGAKFPRGYYRCTHKNDQGCQATKQVQKIEDDSSNYMITYMGHHTCKDLFKNPLLLLDSTCTKPFSLSFESNSIRNQKHPFSSLINSTNQKTLEENVRDFPQHKSIKQETHEEVVRDFPQYNSSPSSSSEYLLPSDFSLFQSCGPLTKLPVISSNHGDCVYASSPGSDTFDMDIKLDDMFCFDDEDLFQA